MKKTEMRYCKSCDAVMPCEKSSPNHILHIILSIITAGIWLIVYAILALESAFKPWRCQKCRKRC